MMSLLWYYRPEHLQGGRSPSMHEVSCLARWVQQGGQKRGCDIKTWHTKGTARKQPSPPSSPLGVSISQLMFQMGIMTLERRGFENGNEQFCPNSGMTRWHCAPHPFITCYFLSF